MITRIEIDGFKTFKNFSLDLQPFQVIVGLNGAGKSNLFDALRLLSLLATMDLRNAFQKLRGEGNELFSIYPDGSQANCINLAVELLVEDQVNDNWGDQAKLKYTRLRYELEISRSKDSNGLERLNVSNESLTSISRGNDRWLKKQGPVLKGWLPKLTGGRAPFISTDQEVNGMAKITTINLHQDGRAGRKDSVAEKMESTILSSVNRTDFPHVLAVRQEMLNWNFLQLNPEELRKPSSMLAPQYISTEGANLPSAIARLQAEDPALVTDISRDISNLIPGIVKIEIEKDVALNRYILWATTQDGRKFTSRVLSDGTLRVLALVTLKNDSQQRGVLCFEEPENGVHPFRLKKLADLLDEYATNLSDPDQQILPLRQLLINTHSPIFVRQEKVINNLLFAQLVSHFDPNEVKIPFQVTRIVPVDSQYQFQFREELLEPRYTLDHVLKFLDSSDAEQAIETIYKMRNEVRK